MAKRKKSEKRKPLVELRFCNAYQCEDGEYFGGMLTYEKAFLPKGGRKVRVEVREIQPKRKAKR